MGDGRGMDESIVTEAEDARGDKRKGTSYHVNRSLAHPRDYAQNRVVPFTMGKKENHHS